jgi:hypothetical protein
MLQRFTIKRKCLLLLAAGLFVSAPGCTMMNTSALSFTKKEPEYLTPRQIVPVWSDTVLHQPGEPATRGFGGRIMFYGEDKHKAIRVDGTLVVYAWDDSKGSMERTPDRKYVFPSDKLQTHYSQSRLGHSYSFWVPWDAAGGPLQHLTLISRFVSNDGTELTAAPAHVVLQGPGELSPFQNEIAQSKSKADKKLNAGDRLRAPSGSGIQRVGYEVEESDSDDQRSSIPARHPGLQTSEISLTSGFYHRNMQGRQTQDSGSSFEVKDADDLLGPELSSEPRAFNSDRRSKRPASSEKNSSHDDDEKSEEDSNPPSTRLQPFESRVRTSRAARSVGDPLRKEPLPAKWLNGLPATPRSSTNETE